MSGLLKWLYFFRRRCAQKLKNLLRRPLPDPPAPLLRFQGVPLPFLQGANLPWLKYGGDFGASAWDPRGGMAATGRKEELLRHLRTLKAQGIDVLRWFLFCDGRAGIRFSAAGTPLGPDHRLYADIDAALDALMAEGMKVIFVLFDFLWFDRPGMLNGVQMGGRSRVISGPYKQQALRRRVLVPLLQRYGRSPAILSWDIINEPEWATRGWGGGIIGPAISFPAMRRFIRRAVRLVHRHTGHLATVGLGNASGLPLVWNCGLDLYQVHWYDRWQEIAPLERPVAEMALDRPLLLGEFPTRNASLPPQAIIDLANASGYCGALAWSWLAADEFSGMRNGS
ncbi:MAG: hypothetical protein MUC72_08170 [Acidobacteria bacterium]|jgi:hypothetical protein|nr:hypothetical protein [Acidobacteriota bacterium]